MSPNKYRSVKRQRRLFFSACIILVLLSLVVWFFVVLIRSLLLNQVVIIDVLSHDTVTETKIIPGLLVKEEIILRSPLGGEVNLLFADGERASSGAVVAEVKALSLDSPGGASRQYLYAPKAGIMCNHIDGLEEVLVPATVHELDLSRIDTIRISNPPDGAVVEKGQPVFKLVDNLKPILVHLEIPEGVVPTEILEEGSRLKLKHKDTWVTGNVIMSVMDTQPLTLWVSISSYPEDFIHMRHIELELLKTELNGLLVPEEVLVYRDDQPGMYIVQKQRVRWMPVEISLALKGQVTVESDRLANGVRYIANPLLFKEGDRIYK